MPKSRTKDEARATETYAKFIAGELANRLHLLRLAQLGFQLILLHRREEQFRSLIENASDLITVINAEGVIRFQSPSVSKPIMVSDKDFFIKETN